MRRNLILFCIMACSAPMAVAGPQTVSILEMHLSAGKLAEGEAALAAEVQLTPQDAQARFGMGTVQFLRAVERLSQSLFRHGFLREQRRLMVGIELPIPDNRNPEKINYRQSRAIIQQFVTDLTKAEATLAQVNADDVQLPLHFGLIWMATEPRAPTKPCGGSTRDSIAAPMSPRNKRRPSRSRLIQATFIGCEAIATCCSRSVRRPWPMTGKISSSAWAM